VTERTQRSGSDRSRRVTRRPSRRRRRASTLQKPGRQALDAGVPRGRRHIRVEAPRRSAGGRGVHRGRCPAPGGPRPSNTRRPRAPPVSVPVTGPAGIPYAANPSGASAPANGSYSAGSSARTVSTGRTSSRSKRIRGPPAEPSATPRPRPICSVHDSCGSPRSGATPTDSPSSSRDRVVRRRCRREAEPAPPKVWTRGSGVPSPPKQVPSSADPHPR
jgi:hypothetical protein